MFPNTSSARLMKGSPISLRDNRASAAEVKFLVTPTVAEQLCAWARDRLPPDPYGGGVSGDRYHISSVYCDTEQLDVFHRRGSFARSKYRVRRYGGGDVVFLERKLKTHGCVSKRRSLIPIHELDYLGGSEPEHRWAGAWFYRRLLARRLAPVCRIAYDRTARVAMTEWGPIRLTLDENLRALPAERANFDLAPAGVPLLENAVILEFKFRSVMPGLFKYLVAKFALNPQPVSKYRLAMRALNLADAPAAELDTSPRAVSNHA